MLSNLQGSLVMLDVLQEENMRGKKKFKFKENVLQIS